MSSGNRTLAALAAALLGACGGERAPNAPTPDTGIPAGTALSILSGETGQPVAGATVTVGGRTQMSDGNGTVRLDQRVELGALVDILSPGTLDRQTLLRSAGSVRFPLWPRQSVTGLDEAYTSTLVYNAGPAAPSGRPLARVSPAVRQVTLVLSAELWADAAAAGAHQQAAAHLTAANGSVAYGVTDTRPSGGVVFEVSVDPAHARCAADPLVRGTTGTNVSGSAITGGVIVYCRFEVAQSVTATHELGHTFGLAHSPDPQELMHGTFSRGRSETFGARESLAMRLMLQRSAGNLFPDNDRSTTGAASTATLVTVCR